MSFIEMGGVRGKEQKEEDEGGCCGRTKKVFEGDSKSRDRWGKDKKTLLKKRLLLSDPIIEYGWMKGRVEIRFWNRKKNNEARRREEGLG
jgi:hypothetical protein